ncbi:MAG: hypothetical protein US96_C0014G0014 [Candidatus Woesebacteria bacterium GW2011_GWB1_38_5b]|uniref:Antitoxin n=1 Tax=Candidatus Woesebacteria bacterium GW2011_GWB1_38_5b TaxID=1618569 RepID=A0A0G0NDT3_9BACT|nr:MAG: hypothetical protein US96_C0014G0014 [Candidatus Woesebacteria bacterium GW2011_GWB1_38_5b]
MQIIQIDATKLRKNLFELIDRVSKGELEVLINKKGLAEPVVLKKGEYLKDTSIENDLKLVRELYGSIKTSGYKKNEEELVRKAFVKEYKRRTKTIVK